MQKVCSDTVRAFKVELCDVCFLCVDVSCLLRCDTDSERCLKHRSASRLSEDSDSSHYASVCLSACTETDRSQTDVWKDPLSCSSSASVRAVQERKPSSSSLPLCWKVTARLIGINQLAAPVEWRRRDLKRNGIDPQREVYTAPGPVLVTIHLPQHNIIIPNSSSEEEGASLGFLGQEQKARETKLIKKERKRAALDSFLSANMMKKKKKE